MSSIKTSIAVAALAVVGIAAWSNQASAMTTFDPNCNDPTQALPITNSSGACGFAGKGDLQTPWTWSNQTLQNEAKSITFWYLVKADYKISCQWTNPEDKEIDIHFSRNTHVNDTVDYDSRANSKGAQGPVTGFFLTSLGDSISTGDNIPSVGDLCPGDSNKGLVTAVDLIEGSNSGTLYAEDVNTPTSAVPTAIWINGVSVAP